MKNPIQTFEPNEDGRDFVIGDLHGSLECFTNLLKNLEFDPTKDRMFSVGDLVDRGPDSLECLMLLKEPWFHAVLANHEQLMLEAFDDGYLGQFWVQNGGLWGYTALKEYKEQRVPVTNELDRPPPPSHESMRLFDVLDYVRDLPFLITVKMPDGKKFHIIHAELPPGNLITDADLALPEKVMELAKVSTGEGDYFCWGRFIFLSLYGKDLTQNTQKMKRVIAYKYRTSFGPFNDDLSHIISGHTIMQRPATVIGQTNIDTQAYGSMREDARRWQGLTCVELKTWKFYQATPTEFRIGTPFVINKDDILSLRPEFAANPGVIP